MKNSVPFLLLASALVSISVKADSLSIDAIQYGIFNTNFCGEPMRTTCENFSMSTQARFKRLQDRAAGYAASAINLTRRDHKLGPAFFTKIQDLKTLPISIEKKQAILNTYLHYMGLLSGVVNSMESQQRISSHIQTIKRYLLASVDDEFPASGFTQITNQQLKKEINRTIIIEAGNSSGITGKTPAHTQVLQKSFLDTCGEDGLGLNAYAQAVGNEKYLVICPGWLMASSGESYDSETNLQNLLQVLGHEWGHHIDSAYFPQLYTKFAQCIGDHHSGELLPLQLQMLSKEQRARIPAGLDLKSTTTKVAFHLREMVADLWGARVVRRYLKEKAWAWNTMQKLHVVREAYGTFCEIPSEGIHPTPDFRISLLMGQDPGLRSFFGCPFQLQSRACTLNGLQSLFRIER